MIDAFAGRSERSRAGVDLALRLSPLDPMMGPMLTARSLSYMVEGDFARARDWALKAARHAPEHTNILCVAASACELAGDHVQALHFTKILRSAVPDMTMSMYMQSVPLAGADVHANFRDALRRLGIAAAG